MEKSRLETKVGVFVFIGLLLIATLMVWFSKGANPFSSTYILKLHTANVGGLKPQSAVLLAGVGVGDVEHIQLDPSGTNVTIFLRIYSRYPIYHDARFVIEMSGFLGDQYVSVIPTLNASPVLTNGADVECEAPFNLQEVARGAAGFIARLDGTAKKLDASVTDLRSQVLNAQTLATFGTSMTNLRSFTEQADQVVGDIHKVIGTNSSQVTLLVSNFVLFSAQLNQLGNTASNVLATNGDNLTAATKNIQLLTEDAHKLVTDIEAGQGLAGALVQNGPASTNLQILTENLSIASSNLNRFGLWHFLWSHQTASNSAAAKPITLESPPIRR